MDILFLGFCCFTIGFILGKLSDYMERKNDK